jgi:hypothetical protein
MPDLLDYIQSVIASALSNLPSSMKQFIYFGSFSHLAGKLMGIVLNPDEKKMSIGFVKNFNVDLSHLEMFVKELKDVSLGDCFGELRQVYPLFLTKFRRWIYCYRIITRSF